MASNNRISEMNRIDPTALGRVIATAVTRFLDNEQVKLLTRLCLHFTGKLDIHSCRNPRHAKMKM